MTNSSRLPKVIEPALRQPREWLEIEPRVRVVALRFENRARRLIAAGAKPFEITAEDLIQDAWTCLIAKTPPFDPSRQSLFKYFLRRMEDRFTNICRDRIEHDLSRFSYFEVSDTSDDSDERRSRVIYLPDEIDPRNLIEARDELNKLLQWLAGRHPDLYRLARVIAVQGEIDPKDQALSLGLTINETYELRRRLKEVALRFRRLTNTTIRGK